VERLKELIVYGSLLHDIGKLIYRGLEGPAARHQELGALWAKEEGLPDEIVTIVKRHHCLRRNVPKHELLGVDSYEGSNPLLRSVLQIVDMADNMAAGMGRQDVQQGQLKVAAPLKSIFSSISIDQKNVQTGKVWEPRSIDNRPYPIDAGSYSESDYEAYYRSQWSNFCNEFKKVKSHLSEDTLLVLLQKYTMMTPECTKATPEGPPDTSLYHHLKSTAAIAWCICRYLTDGIGRSLTNDLSDVIYNTGDPKFLLIAGDFSGIQNFIYTIASKAALKTVRARSFYLELLQECVVSHLVEELDLCRSCIIFSSGGGFNLLAPNCRDVKSRLDAFSSDFNHYLWNNFGQSLYLAIAAKEVNASDLIGSDSGTADLGTIWSDLNRSLGEAKGKKWQSMLEDDFTYVFSPKSVTDTCDICHLPLDNPETTVLDGDEFHFCTFCKQMIRLGRELPRTNELYEMRTPRQGPGLSIYGHYYALRPPDAVEDIACKYLMAEPWGLDGCSGHVRSFPVGSYFYCNEFLELVKDATGFKRLGILRMDVDHLGQVFSRGLGSRNSFARLNDLSERLNLYFKYYLPRLLSGKMDDPLTGIQRDRPSVNLIYSGGDDLFLVGTWDSALDAAKLIYEDFTRFAVGNLTLSGGLTIADEREAFYRTATTAGVEEQRAKENGRDSLGFANQAFKWGEIYACKKNGQVTLHDLMGILTRNIEIRDGVVHPQAFNRSLVQKLYSLIDFYAGQGDDDGFYWVYPQISYLMARAMHSSQGRPFQDSFYRPLLSVMLEEHVLKKLLGPALMITDYLTRGGI
jgi:CRISPR-associated protein Csm1